MLLIDELKLLIQNWIKIFISLSMLLIR